MPVSDITVATSVSTGIATSLIGLVANYPWVVSVQLGACAATAQAPPARPHNKHAPTLFAPPPSPTATLPRHQYVLCEQCAQALRALRRAPPPHRPRPGLLQPALRVHWRRHQPHRLYRRGRAWCARRARAAARTPRRAPLLQLTAITCPPAASPLLHPAPCPNTPLLSRRLQQLHQRLPGHQDSVRAGAGRHLFGRRRLLAHLHHGSACLDPQAHPQAGPASR